MDIFLILLYILIIGCIIAIFYSLIMLYRNNKVYKTRIWFIDNESNLYDKLPSYEYMLKSFKPTNKEYWLKYCKDK